MCNNSILGSFLDLIYEMHVMLNLKVFVNIYQISYYTLLKVCFWLRETNIQFDTKSFTQWHLTDCRQKYVAAC